MARRRMFTLSVINSDRFMLLPHDAQLLYFHLGLQADDEGFVQNPCMMLRILDISDTALQVLSDSGYIHRFPSGVILILHWRQHNTIKKDRSTPTTCREERAQVALDENRVYILLEPDRNRYGAQAEPQNRVEQKRAEENSQAHCTPLPLRNGTNYIESTNKLVELRNDYSSVNVDEAFQRMRVWLLSHPDRQRDADQMETFIRNWLTRDAQKTTRKEIPDDTAVQTPPPERFGTVL